MELRLFLTVTNSFIGDKYREGRDKLYLDSLLPVDAEDASKDVERGLAAIATVRRNVLESLRNLQDVEVVLAVEGLGTINQFLAMRFLNVSKGRK